MQEEFPNGGGGGAPRTDRYASAEVEEVWRMFTDVVSAAADTAGGLPVPQLRYLVVCVLRGNMHQAGAGRSERR